MTLLADCRCLACNGPLKARAVFAADAIIDDAVACEACGRGYPAVWGVPFLCDYEKEEVLGLIEIAANAETNPRIPRESMEALEAELERYHAIEDKPGYLASSGSPYAAYIPNRYAEWLQVETLTHGLDLVGKRILDVGAGVGFDAFRLLKAGADVTALEFSPILCRVGMAELPEARWIGGLSHLLPFGNGTFDYVFCNAALHHMRDIPQAISEMLRVLRPGGALITTSDSFCADSTPAELELKTFNDHPAVLMGVNERVPLLGEFLATPERFRDRVAPQLWTVDAYDVPDDSGRRAHHNGLRQWDIDRDRQRLGQGWGSIALKLSLLSPTGAPPARQTEPGVPVADFARRLASQADAMARLVPLAPTHEVNAPFPGRGGSKFQLLNGWQAPPALGTSRRAYRRARWYLARTAAQTGLAFEVSAPETAAGDAFAVLLDGVEVARSARGGGWQAFAVPLESRTPGVPFCVEIRLEGAGHDLATGCFHVRGRRFEPRSLSERIGDLAGRLLGRAG
jgi:SAM-dependent methyltransferase